MTDEPEVHTAPVVKVAANLRAIATLHDRLFDQAVNDANDPLMPGGKAMVELAYVAKPSQYAWQVDYLERVLDQHPDLSADDDEWEPPLQTLCFWSDEWRIMHDKELDGRRATIATEANFLRWCLDWAWDNEPRFEDFARDVAAARRRIEDTLSEGQRPERTRVLCDRCEVPRQLIKVYGDRLADDLWKCPECKHKFDMDAMQRAYAKQLRSETAEKFVPWLDALGTLRALGRPERTIRKWIEPAEDGSAVVASYCDRANHKVWIWWPDLWHLHLSTPTRKRVA